MARNFEYLKVRMFTAIITVLCAGSLAWAKEMPQRLGLGIKDNTSQSLPSLAVVYNINGNLAMTGGFGVDTQKDHSATQVNVGTRHIIFHEQHLHFYAGGQLGLANFETPADGKQSGFEANLILGTELFFAGLENVGWSFEGGLGLSSVKNTRVRTIADHPFKAGMLFYF